MVERATVFCVTVDPCNTADEPGGSQEEERTGRWWKSTGVVGGSMYGLPNTCQVENKITGDFCAVVTRDDNDNDDARFRSSL